MTPRSFQAIITKRLPYTATHTQRVKATAAAGSYTANWNDAYNEDQNHMAAARALANRFDWSGEWFMGRLKTGDVVFICPDTDNGGPIPAFVAEGKKR